MKLGVENTRLIAIGDAIRTKRGTQGLYSLAEMPDEILSIETEAVIEQKNISANGTYTAPTGVDGFSPVVVNVPNSYSASDEGKVVDDGALVAQTSLTVTENDTYDTTTNNEVVVEVENSYSASDEGKVVDNGELVAQTSRTIDDNGTYDTTLNNEVVVDVEGGSATLIPKTITENGTYDPLDDDADGYNEVIVDVASGGISVENNEPYNLRPISDVGIERGNRERGKIIGGTVNWNQLVQTGSSSVTIPSGRKYYANINGTKTIGQSSGTAIAINDATEDNVMDLTAMFGSTIADYIYSLEQANAGDGVAWFRKHFPKDYYEHNSGSLESVNVSAHVMRGFNQWDEEWELGGIDGTTGANVSTTATGRSKNYIHILPNKSYYLKSPMYINARWYDANKSYLGYSVLAKDASFVAPYDDAHYLRFVIGETTYNNDICINISNADKNGTYEPYVEYNYPLDSSVTLNGYPMLDENNNLVYDGDVYEYDGTVTRNYTIRAYQSGDESLADAITDGTNTVVKLVTPTTESADPYTYIQKMDVNGTEEFIDYAESQGTRDVAIPVGHETEYYQMDAKLVSKTITENGTYNPADDNADGYEEVTVEVSGGGTSDIDTSLLPNSDATKILMSQDDSIASVDHWGRLSLYDKSVTRANPITIGQDGSFQFAGDTFGTFHLSQANVDVTVYAVAKVITLSSGDLGILGITYYKSSWNSALFYTRSSAGFYINTSTYGDDTQTQYTIDDYALLAVSVNQTTKKARFFINGNYVNEKSFSNTGNQVIFNSFGLSDTGTNVCAFKFMGIVDECESDATIIANMQAIATKLGLTI